MKESTKVKRFNKQKGGGGAWEYRGKWNVVKTLRDQRPYILCRVNIN